MACPFVNIYVQLNKIIQISCHRYLTDEHLMFIICPMRYLKVVRLDIGLTLFDVAKVTGIEASRLSKFERNVYQQIAYEDMKRLSIFYSERLKRSITIDQLLELVPDPAPAEVAP